MAASRSPSPGDIPEPNLLLSPKSRMEARLAAIETSSEDEEDEPLPVQRRKKTPPTITTQPDIASEADSEDGIRPRGRLAARMQGAQTESNSSWSLFKSPPRTTTTQEVSQKDAQEEEEEEEDDDDDLPVAPRRLKQRQARDTATPPPPSRSPSAKSTPGLFVSSPPANTQTENAGNSDSDQDFPSLKNDRFKALVERKRAERLAREAEEEEKRQERLARQAELDAQILEDDDGNASGITDDEGGLKLTQGARPTRKAGKKAIEEMNRETQRMARNMQLAHEAKTRKKISKASLFERFNFRTAATDAAPEAKTSSSSRPTSPVSAAHSDVEMGEAGTPPSSPPVDVAPKETQPTQIAPPPVDEDEELPDLDTVMLTQTQAKIDKGKEIVIDSPPKISETKDKPKRQFRVKLPKVSVNRVSLSSDDELEITTTRKNKLDAVFDRIPKGQSKETNSLHALRMLAQVKSPGKGSRAKGDRSTMTPAELQFSLHQRARQQAKEERERRMEMLKAKGIVVQTEEEREREMQDVEDIVSKARKEAEEIMDREREAAREERRKKIKNGELDPLAWDDSEDDDDYEGSDEGQADADQEDLELSGSEDENAEANDDDEDADMTNNDLMDEQASEDDKDSNAENQDSEEEAELPTRNARRAKKHVQIISDDEDEDAIVEATPKPKTTAFKSPAAPNTKSPAAPTSVLRSATKNFIPGLPVAGPAGLGLTQIFAGTMDDSQFGPASGASMQSPMPSIGFPDFDNMSQDNTQPGEDMVLDSQGGDTQKAPTQAGETQGVQLHYTQSQMHGFDSLLRDSDDFDATQISIEPSQDGGLGEYTPLRERFMSQPASTAQTVVHDAGAEDAVQDSPLVRRGRLRKKIESIVEEDEASTADIPASIVRDSVPPTNTAFGALAEAAKKEKKRKEKAEYNKKKSKAKDMFHEQADESEDEYAGLGGADGEDDDSDLDDTASVKEMIDDEGGNADDDRKNAALFADRERARDEQMVDKLFHDITSGALRRKRGADYDLSDSDDGGEARRRLKRRQFAKMQKALFADDRIKKIAEKPGNSAFMRTLEDRESDDEMDFLEVGPETLDTEGSQSASQDQTVPDSQPTATAGGQLGSSTAMNRRPANDRRTKNGKKPSNISEIRESVSFLLEDNNASIIPATEAGSDDEMDEDQRPGTSHSNKENANPGTNPRRTAAKPVVIDRMSLKRQSSSNLSATSKLAFAMPAGAGSTGFKVPALLRRATTNSLASATSSSSTGTSTSGGRFGDEGKIKRTAGKRSGVSALARETERRAAMQENEKRREAKKWKGAEKRGRAVGGLFGSGKFE